MKISSLKIKLTKKDIKGIIDEYLDIDELKIEDIEIDNFITLYGEINKGFNLKFKIKIGVGRVYNNEINLKIFKIKLGKLPVPIKVVSSIVKHYVKKLEDIGLVVNNGYIKLKVNLLMKFLPYVYLNLKNINLIESAVELEAEDVIVSQNKEIEKIEFKEEKIDEDESIIVKDRYTDFRRKITKKVPLKYDKLVEYIMIVPDLISLLCRLMKDKRVSGKIKLMIGASITYLISPIDVLPDIIPVVGKIDDVSLAFFVLDRVVREVPEIVIKDNWEGEEDIILKIREGYRYICDVIGSRNIIKLLKFIKKIGKRKTKN